LRSRTVRVLASLTVAVSLALTLGNTHAGATPPPVDQELPGDEIVIPRDPPTVEVGGECGAPSLTFHNPTRYPILFKYVEDGEFGAAWVAPGKSQTAYFGPYEEESEHELKYKIWLPRQEWTWVEVETDCLETVIPLAPTATSPTCENLANGGLQVPAVNGVVYSHGSGPANPGEYHVTATPAEGFEFPEGAVTEWHLVVNPPGDCTGPTGPQGPTGPPAPPTVVNNVVNNTSTPTPATAVRHQPNFTG
jgi:hypothetical protein